MYTWSVMHCRGDGGRLISATGLQVLRGRRHCAAPHEGSGAGYDQSPLNQTVPAPNLAMLDDRDAHKTKTNYEVQGRRQQLDQEIV